MRVIGVGASAGGLEALNAMFESLSPEHGHAWIVVQHLSREHKSLMAEILGRRTKLPVTEATDGERIEANRIYLGPAHANISVEAGCLRLIQRTDGHGLNLPVDELFRSLAAAYGDQAIGVVLSGTGSDGREGVHAIKGAGGTVIVQDPASSRFDGMPQAAISTGLIDSVVSADRIAAEVLRLTQANASPLNADPAAFDQVLDLLRLSCGIDFTEYKTNTVARRIHRRVQLLQLASIGEYLERLRNDTVELKRLADELLINVTRFFRDPPVWQLVATHVIAELARQTTRDQVRVWVPGCASGPEAYTVAMLLHEGLPAGRDFKVFATDIDPVALQVAAAGRYGEDELAELSVERRERFFVHTTDGWVVDPELRRHLLFANHNLAQDPPFTKLDLVSCRNVLIYFTPELQHRVLRNFGFALKGHGYLLLGPSESLGDLRDDFATLDAHWKLFAREGAAHAFAPSLKTVRLPGPTRPPPQTTEQLAVEAGFRLLTERVAPTSVLVNEQLELLSVYGNASSLLAIPPGSPTLHLPRLLHPTLQTVVSMATHRALTSSAPVQLVVGNPEPTGITNVRAMPLTVPGSTKRFLIIALEQQSAAVAPAIVVASEAEVQLAELQRQLRQARESLQATVEEFETSSEELQSTNEELMAANEELQSTNEELQSLNEELNSVNAEHRARIDDLTQANEDLDNLFNASSIGVLFLDRNLLVRRFTNNLTRHFPLLRHDVGRPITDLAPAMTDPQFVPDIKQCIETGQTVEREVGLGANRLLVRVAPYLSSTKQVRGVVVSFTDVSAVFLMTQKLQAVIDSMQQSLAVIGLDGTIGFVNQPWQRFAAQNGGTHVLHTLGVGANYFAVCQSEPEVERLLREVVGGQRVSFSWEYPCHGPTEQRWFLMYASRMNDGSGAVISHLDITQRKQLEGGSP